MAWIELKPEGAGPIRAWRADPAGPPLAGVREVAAAHPEVEVHAYPADHGFNCDHRESYHKPSADLAWTRTIEFLRKRVG